MADPSIVGAAQALVEHLRSTFPSVPLDTICAITAQHASDPNKCWDLVRLESSRPTSTEQATPNYANGGSSVAREPQSWIPGTIIRPRGSYVIRRSQDSPSLQAGAMRDTRSCTPPRIPPDPNQRQHVMTPPMANVGPLARPQTLDVHSVLQHRSPSPVAQHRLPALNVDAVHSCPGTPTGNTSAVPRSVGFAGNIPALKINYQTNGSQITLSPSPGPNSPTLVVSSQPSGGGKPVYYQFARTTSQGSPGLVGVPAPPPGWQYVRRPSYADVELAQRAAGQQSTSASTTSGLDREPLRVSADNLSDSSSGYASISPGAATANGQPLIRAPASVRSSSPNIRISLDPRGGGAIITGDPVIGGPARIRPRVTFGPMVAIQPNYSRPTAAFTVSLRQPSPQSPIYDSSTLVKTAAITNAQAEECLKSVLEHQRSRLADMKKAMAAARARLEELRMDVDSMEQDLTKRRKHSVRSAAISDEEMSILHKETRELQAEIQTMLRELDIHKVNAGTQKTVLAAETGKPVAGAGRDNRVAAPGQIAGDLGGMQRISVDGDEQWSCSLCTFRNHIDVPVCEVCEMPRVTDDHGGKM